MNPQIPMPMHQPSHNQTYSPVVQAHPVTQEQPVAQLQFATQTQPVTQLQPQPIAQSRQYQDPLTQAQEYTPTQMQQPAQQYHPESFAAQQQQPLVDQQYIPAQAQLITQAHIPAATPMQQQEYIPIQAQQYAPAPTQPQQYAPVPTQQYIPAPVQQPPIQQHGYIPAQAQQAAQTQSLAQPHTAFNQQQMPVQQPLPVQQQIPVQQPLQTQQPVMANNQQPTDPNATQKPAALQQQFSELFSGFDIANQQQSSTGQQSNINTLIERQNAMVEDNMKDHVMKTLNIPDSAQALVQDYLTKSTPKSNGIINEMTLAETYNNAIYNLRSLYPNLFENNHDAFIALVGNNINEGGQPSEGGNNTHANANMKGYLAASKSNPNNFNMDSYRNLFNQSLVNS